MAMLLKQLEFKQCYPSIWQGHFMVAEADRMNKQCFQFLMPMSQEETK